jgi:hypothetical protein
MKQGEKVRGGKEEKNGSKMKVRMENRSRQNERGS